MTRLHKPTKPTPLKKLLFQVTAQNKKTAMAEAVKAYYKARGEKPKRYIEGKELQKVLKEVFSLDSVKFDTSTGTITMAVKERYFDERVEAYQQAMKDYRKNSKKPVNTRPRRGSAAIKDTGIKRKRRSRARVFPEKVFMAGVKREQGWLYYLDKNCNIARSRMVRGGQRKLPSDKPQVLVKTPIKREDGFLYFIDKQGDVSRTKMRTLALY